MAEYSFAHVGINSANEEEARKAAGLLNLLFGLPVKEGNSSIFVSDGIEVYKTPYLGTPGHIAIATPDVEAARAELEAKGYPCDPDTAKYKPDGTLNAIYLTGEIGGFAVHLVKKP